MLYYDYYIFYHLYHTLKSRIGKHQIFSLIILGLISCIIILLEFIYTTKDVNIGKYIISYSCVVFHFIFLSFTDVIEKYLVDYNYINPFQILMSEGIITIRTIRERNLSLHTV